MDFRRAGVPNAKVVEKEKGKSREEWLVVSRSKGRLCRSNDHENEEFQSLPSSEETPNSPAAKTYMWSRGAAAAFELPLPGRVTKGGLLSESVIRFSNLQISKKKLLQITILNLKFEIPAHNSKQLIQISSSG